MNVQKLDTLPTRETIRPPRHNAKIRLGERRPDKVARRTGKVNHRRSSW